MSQWKAVITWCMQDLVEPDILAPAGISLERRITEDEEEIVAAAKDADAVITRGSQRYTHRMLEQLDRCKVIALFSIGYDGIDVAAATDLGICIANNAYYCTEEVADHNLALLLACARRLTLLDAAVKAGAWRTLVDPRIKAQILAPIRRLSELTVGVVGLGSIGRTFARKASGIGMRVIASVRRPSEYGEIAAKLGIPLVPLDHLLRESDFVSLHVPLTSETRGMIGRDQLRAMKPTAFIVNTARGPLIDSDALVSALSEGWIAGAALDVTEPQPLPIDSPLMKQDNVLLTPHSAYYSIEADRDAQRVPFEEVVRVFGGGWPVALVNPAVKSAYSRKWGR